MAIGERYQLAGIDHFLFNPRKRLFDCKVIVIVLASATQLQAPALIAGLPVGPGVSPQPGFLFRGAWFPLVVTFPIGQSKST